MLTYEDHYNSVGECLYVRRSWCWLGRFKLRGVLAPDGGCFLDNQKWQVCCRVGMWLAFPGHVKWPRAQLHYVQVSVGVHSAIANAFQMDVEARTSDNAALFTGMQLVVAV